MLCEEEMNRDYDPLNRQFKFCRALMRGASDGTDTVQSDAAMTPATGPAKEEHCTSALLPLNPKHNRTPGRHNN